MRKPLPDTRSSITTKITSDSIDAYITVGFYENNQPGEVFIKIAKMGSFMSTMMDQIGKQASILLQTGHTGSSVVEKWKHISGEGGVLLAKIAEAFEKSVSLMGGQIDKGNE